MRRFCSPSAADDQPHGEAKIESAVRRFGTLAEQMPSGGFDLERSRAARARVADIAARLSPADRALFAAVATPVGDGALPGPSVVGRRVGMCRQNAHVARKRLFRRIQRLASLPPLPTVAALAEHIEHEGATPVCARRLAAVLYQPARVVAHAEGVSPRRVRYCVALASAYLRPSTCALCRAVAAHRGWSW